MARNLNPSRMRQRVSFGSLGKMTLNKLGNQVAPFEEKLTVWFGPYTITQSQELALQGTTLAGTKVIFVRHRSEIQRMTNAKIGNIVFNVTDINIEDDPGPNSFDLVTLKADEKHV